MSLLRRIGYLLRQRKIEAELAEEIEFHRRMSGEAKALGNITRAREDARAVWIWPWLESLWQDTAYAIRNLRRSPGFTVVALLTLGTAIGLNTSFFTVFNGVALRPWPVRDPSHVVKIFSIDARRPRASGGGIGVAEYRYLAEHTKSLSGLTVTYQDGVHFGFEPFAHSSSAAFVGWDHFRVLGIQMRLGRGFLRDEDRPEAPETVAVLSYPYWRDHFNSDAEIIGRRVTMDDVAFTVVGVTPKEFTGTAEGGGREDVYLPLSAALLLHPSDPMLRRIVTEAGMCCLPASGRLAPGVSRLQAESELAVLDRQCRSEFRLPGSRTFVLADPTLVSRPPGESQGGPGFALMFIAVTLVVLLACANVGNLLIARAGARQKEIAIRRAIGAGRARIVRQLMTESVLLALGAAVLGLPIAYRLPAFIIAQTGEVLALRLTPDGTVLAYTAALASAACLAFGLAPALRGTRPHPGSRLSLRNLLLAVQVALSVVLLTGAGLALQGVAHLRRQDPGFSIAGVSVVSFELPARDYDPARAGDFDRRLVDALSERLSGRAFGLTDRELFPNGNWHTDFRLPGEPESATRGILAHLANAGYFAVLRIPTLAGRAFAPGDEARDVILVNQSLARLFWKNDSPIGKRVIASGRPRQIIGVVKDAYTENLDRIEATLYLPSFGAAIPKVLVPLSAAEAVAAIAKQIEPRARTQAVPLRDSVERWLKVERIGAEIAALLGLYALILATVGMSGVFAYVVQQRTKEIGIRVALGARPAGVARLVLASSSRAVIAGLCIGVPCAMLGARLMRGVLYGVSPLDPFAYLSVACILAGAALAASYAPARRAARVDPPEALRHE